MEIKEQPSVIYSIYRDTDAKYVLFTTKRGVVKKTSLDEYLKTKKKNGIAAINIKEGDELVNVSLIKEEQIMLVSKKGKVIRFNSNEIGISGRTTMGVKGMNLDTDDEIVSTVIIRNPNDQLAVFSAEGHAKKVELKDFLSQKRGGKGIICSKEEVAAATLVEDNDTLLVCGRQSSICVKASEIPLMGRTAAGNAVINNSNIVSVSKV